ncbi:2,5-didehydrogluconate reductase DkgB [Gayadomonas joobiniege]|uniref:2,5-didehydrogluconate reductase DkgB n=1 Tax=Gayadomonas joobiniege TaxID=1234606 RepID=UPI00037BA3D4|nr:2,5-didehydrogluconate reductase DkgB [Gayadomonas joobiniege]
MVIEQRIPRIGLGTYRMKGEVAINSVKIALELGYRHIDTAQIYKNEAEIGHAIAQSQIARDEVFLTSKVWLDNLTPKRFLPSVIESLQQLKTDHLDLLLIHWPAPNDETAMAVYLDELCKIKKQGLTRFIGVSNFTCTQLASAMSFMPANEIYTNQIEVHPYLQNNKVRDFCRQHNILVTAYMPFAVGKVLADPQIKNIANQYKVTSAQIVLAWAYSQGMVSIPSSTKKSHLSANLAALEFNLKEQDIQLINQLDSNQRQANPDFAPVWDSCFS